jgi:hypothetical protein
LEGKRMARFNFVEDRDALPVDDELEDGDEPRGVRRARDVVADGQGIRVRLMHADSAPPVTWVAPIRDAAPPRPVFDARWHQPGYRTFEMVRDAVNALRLDDAAGDPVEAARAARIASQGRAWRDGMTVNINYNASDPTAGEASAGQVANSDPDAAIETEEERANRERGGEVYDAREDYKRRIGDAWKHNHSVAVAAGDAWQSPNQLAAGKRFADIEARLRALVPEGEGNSFLDREIAREARKLALGDAWRHPSQPTSNEAGGGPMRGGPAVQTLKSRPMPRAAGGQAYNAGADPDALGSAWGLHGENFFRNKRVRGSDGVPIADREQAYAERCARLESAWQTP